MRRHSLMTSCAVLVAICTLAETRDPRVKTLRVNGVDLAHVDQGRGEPVVLIHGAMHDYRVWSEQWPELSKRYRVIAYSRRYHHPNRPPGKASEYSVSAHAADLVALAKALKLGRAHLVGHSAGANIAALVARAQPEVVRSLVLGEPLLPAVLGRSAEGKALLPLKFGAEARQAFQKGDIEGAARIIAKGVLGRDAYDEMPSDRRRILLENLPRQMTAEGSTPPAPLAFTCEDASRIAAPTLLLMGDRTPRFFQLTIEELQKCLPGSERAVLPQSSHGLQLENPVGFNQVVSEFLSRRAR